MNLKEFYREAKEKIFNDLEKINYIENNVAKISQLKVDINWLKEQLDKQTS